MIIIYQKNLCELGFNYYKYIRKCIYDNTKIKFFSPYNILENKSLIIKNIKKEDNKDFIIYVSYIIYLIFLSIGLI